MMCLLMRLLFIRVNKLRWHVTVGFSGSPTGVSIAGHPALQLSHDSECARIGQSAHLLFWGRSSERNDALPHIPKADPEVLTRASTPVGMMG